MAAVSHDAGGVGAAVLPLARELARSCEVEIVASGQSGADAMIAADTGGARLRLCEPSGPAVFRYAPKMGAVLASGRPRLVHAHGLWQYPSIAADRYCRRSGAPMTISPHGMLEAWALAHRSRRKRLALALFQRRILENATCFHALTEAEVGDIRALGLKQPVAVIPNGVAIPELPARGSRAAPARRKRLVFVGRLHKKKGLQAVIEAWRLLKLNQPDLSSRWTFCICGWDDGGHEDELRRQIAASGLEPHEIALLGALYGEQRDALLATADAFVLASVSEGLPMSVLEAWSFAVPVFMTRACNLSEAFAAKAAVEIEGTGEAIAETFARFLPSPELGAIGAAGRRLVEETYAWPAVGAAHLAVYRWMLGIGERPDFVHACA